MEPIIFTEDQLQNLDAIGAQLFDDEQDPRSYSYKRKLNRPNVSWLKIIAYLFILLILLSGSVVITKNFSLPIIATVLISTTLCLIYILLTLKRAIICIVKIYQKYAPDHIRNKCRFEPSCSEYMILAIEKYGIFKGVSKGIKRLRRCNTNDGGFDYP